MARLLDIFSDQNKEQRAVRHALARLDREKTPVRLEIENTLIHFYTRVSVKASTVVIAKPTGLRDGLKKGGIVRFRLPDGADHEVRMEIAAPHFNLSNGTSVFLCKLPEGFAEPNQRNGDRYNTSRFNNILLEVAESTERFRVIDISISGFKFYVNNREGMNLFPVGEPLHHAAIHLGERVKVELETLIPRIHRANTVGCEMKVRQDGPSRKYLQHLINSLAKIEAEKLHV